MSFIEPVIEHPIPEATRYVSDAENLGLLLAHDIPGFIIKGEISDPVIDYIAVVETQVENTNRLEDLVQDEYPKLNLKKHNVLLYTGSGQGPIGCFHHDAVEWDPSKVEVPSFFIHTTLTGGGEIIVAHFGIEPQTTAANKQFASGGYRPGLKDHPHDLLLDYNQVDTRFVDPNIYVGKVAAGDSVVVSNNNSRAAWHRFDTDQTLGERTVRCAEFRP